MRQNSRGCGGFVPREHGTHSCFPPSCCCNFSGEFEFNCPIWKIQWQKGEVFWNQSTLYFKSEGKTFFPETKLRTSPTQKNLWKRTLSPNKIMGAGEMRIVGRSEGSGREKKKIQFGIAFPLCLEVVCIPVCQSRRRREVFSPQGQGEMKKTLHTVGSSTNREWKTLKMGRRQKGNSTLFVRISLSRTPPPFPF